MQTSTAHITLYKLSHRAQVHIGLRFQYSAAIIQKIKQIEGRKYSKTHNCWYLPYTAESFAAFKKLNLPFHIEKKDSEKTIELKQKTSTQNCTQHSGTVEQGIRTLPTAIEDSKPHHSSDASLPLQEDSDILRTQVGKIAIQFSRKAFIISVPYNEGLIRQIKSLKRVWWNSSLKKWLCYGSHENLEKMQKMFNCWTDLQMEQLRTLIGAYENSKKMLFYRLPDTKDKIAVQLFGYGVDVNPLKAVPNRIYDKAYRRWIIDYDKILLERLVDFYKAKGTQVEVRLEGWDESVKPKIYSPKEKQNYFVAKFKEADRPLVQEVSDRMIQMRYSWKTIQAYIPVLVQFKKSLDNTCLANCRMSDINRFLIAIAKKKVSESTLNRQVSALKFYFSKVKLRPDILIERIERPRKSFKLPKVLSKEEVFRMISVTENIKHKTILFALYASGLRLGELLNMRIDHVQWDRNQLFITGAKGKKDRIVMLSSVLKEALHLYCNECKPVTWLIEGLKAGTKYSAKSVQSIVKQAASRANISQKVTPHTLRHCFATHLHDGGTSIKLIQELLGHKDIKTTMIYTHVSTRTVLAVNSPLDNLINEKSE